MNDEVIGKDFERVSRHVQLTNLLDTIKTEALEALVVVWQAEYFKQKKKSDLTYFLLPI